MLTITRRKEATIAVTWLTLALGKWLKSKSVQQELTRGGLTEVKLTPTLVTTDLTVVGSVRGEQAYTQLADSVSLGLEDWVDKWVATNRDLTVLPRKPAQPAVRFAGMREAGDAPIPIGLPHDQLDSARTGLEEYRGELHDDFAVQLARSAILGAFQQRVDSFDAMLP